MVAQKTKAMYIGWGKSRKRGQRRFLSVRRIYSTTGVTNFCVSRRLPALGRQTEIDVAESTDHPRALPLPHKRCTTILASSTSKFKMAAFLQGKRVNRSSSIGYRIGTSGPLLA